LSTTVNSSTSAQLLVAADGSRTSLTIQNTDANELFIGPDNTVSTTNYQYRRVYGTGYTFDGVDAQQAYYGVWDVDGSGGAVITEITTPTSDGNGAIETYGELKDEIAAWLRPNSAVTADMTARIPTYVGLAEVMIRRELHTRSLDTASASLTVTSGTATVPDGFQAVTSMALAVDPYTRLTGAPLEAVRAIAMQTTNTTPLKYARSGSLFYFDFDGSTTVELFYRRNLSPLVNNSDTNWLLLSSPDVYLFGALMMADKRLIGPRLGEWKESFQMAIDGVKKVEMSLHSDIIIPMPSGYPV
jgi:hypothetical protein